jgi:hypothetical protein
MIPGARFGRQGRILLAAAGIAGAAAAAALAPAPAGLAEEGSARPAFAAFASAAIVALLVLPFSIRRTPAGRRTALAIGSAALVAGLASYMVSAERVRACTATYASRTVIAGTELTPLGRQYTAANPDLPRDELLFDAAGDAAKIWTRASINRCRTVIGATSFLWIPFLVVCLIAAAQAIPGGAIAAAAGASHPAGIPAPDRITYDAFLSYRHGGLDGEVARELLETLEASGYKVAIDERDFAANASFLQEMERCIRESRFTVAIISPRYLESGNCEEEAIVCRVLDMDGRRRRLIPFVIAPVSMPAWLYGLVGISCTRAEPLVDPVEKLKATLGPPAAAADAAAPANR